MKMLLKTGYANARVSANAGAVIDVDEAEAQQLIAGGYAVEHVAKAVEPSEAVEGEGWGDQSEKLAALQAENEELKARIKVLEAAAEDTKPEGSAEAATTPPAPETATAAPQHGRRNP